MRELFAVLVATCGLSNPQQLWDKYKNDVTDDIFYRLREQNPNVTYSDLIYNEGLTKIEDQVKTISGKDLSDYGMNRPQRTEEISRNLIRELDYDTASLQQQLTESVPGLNPEQRLVFDNVAKKIEDGEGGLLFLDAPGGTGKTFLLNLLLAKTLPVITEGTPADKINACLKASTLWVHVKTFSLSTNMRVQLHNDVQSGQYAADLLKIGEDRMAKDGNGMIILDREFCNVVHNPDDLNNFVYRELLTNMRNREWLCERAILAPTNYMVSRVGGDIVEFFSVDTVMDTEQVTSYPVKFLNPLELSGVPSHKLRLKVSAPVLLMGNLDAPRLCYATRLQVTHLGRNM
ncbi:uncharacterized protein LOC125777685 [Bactrocera dorsalis]|uniref:ATP-dependent DNA helicase n=1 Tax=Bactrocera dorsalis TaxID=27457 RepID=A0ABM3JHY4_BACDO|nr:uncharacterized protein LOC125777685 [Bactrocera dorsalis]